MNDTRTYAILAKPVADLCNLRCEYCYYAEKNDGNFQNVSGSSGELYPTVF